MKDKTLLYEQIALVAKPVPNVLSYSIIFPKPKRR